MIGGRISIPRLGRQFDMSYMPCVVVSGARGLLGATLMRVLPDAGFRVIPLTCDIRDAAAVTKQIAQAAPAYVVHAAAMTYVAACMRQPQEAFAVNSQGTKNVVEAARAASARILYISTASVFKGDHGDCREDDAPEPTNAYNQSKREGERHALDYDGGIVLRFNLIGIHPDGQRGKNFFEWLVDGFRANEDMTLFADACINPLSNWTVAALIAKILTCDRVDKIVHIGSRDVLSKAAIGELVRARFPGYRGTMHPGSVDAVADGVYRPKQMWLNTDKAAALLGPMPTVAQELDTIFARSSVLARG
jgi:dTDP-4-dehydrorhamnose reductase